MNVVFIWIPKTAGTSIWKTLDIPKLKEIHLLKKFKNKGIVTFGHMSYQSLVEKGWVTKKFDDTAYKFAFVRNPYKRAVSLYSYLKKHTSFEQFCNDLYKINPVGLYNVKGLSQCNPQYEWISGVGLDYIGRVETIDRDFKNICRDIGKKYTPLPKTNQSKHKKYKEYYTKETIEIIRRIYCKDFSYFGYSEEL